MTKRKEQQPKYKQSETVVIKRSQINFAPYNPRKEDPEVIKKLKKNFKTVGYLGGIVWNQLSSYLVSGHKRVQTLDIINNYDGTPETDYEIKVEAVELDDKTEREQNIFMNSPSAMGEFDMEKIKVLVFEIDAKEDRLNGKIVKLSNRDDILKKPSLPIAIRSYVYNYRLKTDKEKRSEKWEDTKEAAKDGVKDTLMIITAPIWLPVIYFGFKNRIG